MLIWFLTDVNSGIFNKYFKPQFFIITYNSENNPNCMDGKDHDCWITVCSGFCRTNYSLPELYFQSLADELKLKVKLQLKYYCFFLEISYITVTHSAVFKITALKSTSWKKILTGVLHLLSVPSEIPLTHCAVSTLEIYVRARSNA